MPSSSSSGRGSGFAALILTALVAGSASHAVIARGNGRAQPAPPPPPVYPGYALVWADEFNGEGEPDPKNWTYERGFVRNRELQGGQPGEAPAEAEPHA